MKRNRKRLWICLSLIAGINAGALAFSMVTDPFAIHHELGYQPDKFNFARLTLSSYSYVSKAAEIIRNKPDRIILGSSVADHAFRIYGSQARWYDPYPEKTEAAYAATNNDRGLYNAGIRGGAIYEVQLYLQHAYINNPGLKKAILGIEYFMFSSIPTLEMPRVEALGKTYIPLNFYMEYTLSWLAAKSSLEVFQNYSFFSRNVGRAKRLAEKISAYFPDTGDSADKKKAGLQLGASSAELFTAATPSSVQQFVSTVSYVGSMREIYDKKGFHGLMPQERFDKFQSVASFCNDRSVELITYRSPQHPVFWAMIRQYELQPTVEHWLREAAKSAPSWDLSGMIDYNDADRFYGTDTMHFNEVAGDMILKALYTPPGQMQEGAKLVTADTVESVIEWRNNLFNRWEEEHADIAASIRALPVQRLLAHGPDLFNPLSLMPAAYSPDYKGYKIIKFLKLHFAIPASNAAPYDMYTFLQKKYPGMLDADSLAEIMTQIDNTGSR